MNNKSLLEKIRGLAYVQIAKKQYEVFPTPLETLRHLEFEIPFGNSVDQEKIREANMTLDAYGCLGRVAQSAAIIEKHFPDAAIKIGEVWIDALRNMLLHPLLMTREVKEESYYEEILMYEEPHAVLLVEGKQFEPLSVPLKMDIYHPLVQEFPLWEGITSSHLVSFSQLEESPTRRMVILMQAEKICPGTTLVQENKIGLLHFMNFTGEAIALAKDVLEKRPVARTFYFLYLVTGDDKYREIIERKYMPETFKFLEKEVEKHACKSCKCGKDKKKK